MTNILSASKISDSVEMKIDSGIDFSLVIFLLKKWGEKREPAHNDSSTVSLQPPSKSYLGIFLCFQCSEAGLFNVSLYVWLSLPCMELVIFSSMRTRVSDHD